MTHPPTLLKPSEGRTIAFVGDLYRVLATGDDTDGKYALIEADVPPGAGPPLHVHSREEEGFYVLEGEITFTVGDQRVVATPGTFANTPVGVPHTFKNESDRPARMLVSIAPAGLEKMFFEAGVVVAEGTKTAPPPTEAEMKKLMSIVGKYGIEIRLAKH
jgi:quercetin dioxygenase-like cupin family protein